MVECIKPTFAAIAQQTGIKQTEAMWNALNSESTDSAGRVVHMLSVALTIAQWPDCALHAGTACTCSNRM